MNRFTEEMQKQMPLAGSCSLFGKDRGTNLPWDSPTEIRGVTPGRNCNFFLFFLFSFFFFF